jgi:hypothetical protein
MRRIWPIVIGVCCAAVIVASFPPTLIADDATVSEELTDAEFRRLHKLLQPNQDELWRTIPWEIGLLDAQRIAAQEKKPIFIWAMDGHPLGCT